MSGTIVAALFLLCCRLPATVDWIRGRHLTKEKKAISANKIFYLNTLIAEAH